MAISDIDIFRSANLCLAQHGVDAVDEARKRAAELQTAGDRDGADVWLRIMLAIETLQASGPDRAHYS
jgi:hypothetical protein